MGHKVMIGYQLMTPVMVIKTGILKIRLLCDNGTAHVNQRKLHEIYERIFFVIHPTPYNLMKLRDGWMLLKSAFSAL